MKTTATQPIEVITEDGASPDCEKVVSLMDIMIDGEASEEDKTYFFKHVEECKKCFDAHNKHQQLKEFLKDNIKRKAVPTNLLSSIKSVIKATA